MEWHMGDANKIKDLVSASSREYLARSLETTEGGKPYILEDEFAATKRNRSFFVTGITLLTVAAFVATAFLLTRAIERSTESQTVDVSSFEDLNLKDLLDVAKRAQERFDVLTREYGDIERAMDAELRAVTLAYDAEAELIAVERISDSARRSRLATAARRRDAAAADARKRYEPLLAAKKAELDDAAAALDSFDSRRLEQAKKNEELLASERRLFEAEKARLAEYYEERLASLGAEAKAERARLEAAKDSLLAAVERGKAEELAELFALYNPLFDDQASIGAVAAFSERGDFPSDLSGKALLAVGLKAREELLAIEAAIGGMETLSARLAEIPYERSVPEALAAMRNAATSLASSYAAMLDACVALVAVRNEELSEKAAAHERTTDELAKARSSLGVSEREGAAYAGALQSLARESGDAGYVLAVDGARLTLWLDPLAAGATEAWVFRDERAIARLSIERHGKVFRGTVLEAEGEPRPFDKILVTIAPGASPAGSSGGTE